MKQMSKDDFNKNQFCVIKNYANNAQVDNLLEMAETYKLFGEHPYANNQGAIAPKMGLGHILNCSKYPPTKEEGIILDDLFTDISKVRLQVVTEADCTVKCGRQQGKPQPFWARFMRYSNHHTFFPHIDHKGEVMAILFLTQYGEDYTGGLRLIKKDLTEVNVDSYCNKGDLLIVSGGKLVHYVDVTPLSEDGRCTYFMNSHPIRSDDSKEWGQGWGSDEDLEGALCEAREYIKSNDTYGV